VIVGASRLNPSTPSTLLTIEAGPTSVPGPATITFTAGGYLTYILPVTITNRAACANGFTLAADDTTCATCTKAQSGSVCSGNTCLPSTFDFTLARCVCPAGIVGRACEYGRDVRYEIATFNINGTQLSATPSFGDSRAIIAFYRVPNNLLPTANDPLFGGRGVIIVEPPSVANTFVSSLPWVDITKVPLPVEANAVYSVPATDFARGFVIDIIAQDNTPIDVFSKPIEVFYYPDLRVSREYRQLVLFYWNSTTVTTAVAARSINVVVGNWIPAQNTCSPPIAPQFDRQNSAKNIDENFGNIYINVCKAGQYAFFVRTPKITSIPPTPLVPKPTPPPQLLPSLPPNIGQVKAGTTGQTGIQAPLPVQPDFPEQDAQFDAEPARLPLPGSSSSASTHVVSFALVIVMLCLNMF